MTKQPPPPPSLDRPPPLTLREQLEAGPKFHATKGDCIACGSFDEPGSSDFCGTVDRDTRLGMRCWRAWRWSSVRERGGGMEPASDSPSAGGVAGLGTEIPSRRPSPGDAPVGGKGER